MTLDEMRHLDAVKTYKELEEAKEEIMRLNFHINRIEAVHAGKDNQICNLLEICRANGIEVSSQDLINGRTSK